MNQLIEIYKNFDRKVNVCYELLVFIVRKEEITFWQI